MALDAVVSRSFVVIRADQTAAEARSGIDAASADWVIVERTDRRRDRPGTSFPSSRPSRCSSEPRRVDRRRPRPPRVDGRTDARRRRRSGRGPARRHRPRGGPADRLHRPARTDAAAASGGGAGGGDGGPEGRPPTRGWHARAPTTPAPPTRVRRGGQRAKPPAAEPGVRPNRPSRSDRSRPPSRARSRPTPSSGCIVTIVNQAPTATGLGSIDVAAGETVDILVQPRRGFEVVGESHGSSRGARIRREPAAPVQAPGGGRREGRHPRRGLLAGRDARGDHPRTDRRAGARRRDPRSHAVRAGRARRPRRWWRASPRIADLTMFIDEHETGGKLEFTILVSASDPALDLNSEAVRAVHPRGRPVGLLRDLLQGDRGPAGRHARAAQGRRPAPGGQGRLPDRDADAARAARHDVEASRQADLDHHPVRGAMDPVGAVPADRARGGRPDGRGPVPVRGLRDHPLAARSRLQAAAPASTTWRSSCRAIRGSRWPPPSATTSCRSPPPAGR